MNTELTIIGPHGEAVRRCAACTTPMPRARSDAQYCGSTCRSRAFRDQRMTHAGALIGEAGDFWKDEAEQLFDGLALPGASGRAEYDKAAQRRLDQQNAEASAVARGLPKWQGRVEHIQKTRPQVVAVLGLPVVVAACAPLAAGVCRSCAAIAHARAYNLDLPALDAAVAKVLGPPCSRCVQSVREAMAVRMSRPVVTRASSTTAAGPRPSPMGSTPLHLDETCNTCKVSSMAFESLLASGMDVETAQRKDPMLLELAMRRTRAHDPSTSGRPPVRLSRRHGQWKVHYAGMD